MNINEKKITIYNSELNLRKNLTIKDLRTKSHPEYLQWENFQQCIDEAINFLGLCYYPQTFYEYITKLPQQFNQIKKIEHAFKILADLKGIIKFTKKHGKSTYSRYKNEYETLRILTTIQMLKFRKNIIIGYNAWPRIELINHIINFSKKIKRPKILDAGCGSGLNIYMLNKANSDVTIDGFEFTHSRLASCMVNLIYEKNVGQLFLGDITKIDLPDNSYDLVYTNHVIEQLGQKAAESAISQVLRISKYGAIFCEPTIHNANFYETWRMKKLGYCQDLIGIVKKIPNCKITIYKEDDIRYYPNTSNTLVVEKLN